MTPDHEHEVATLSPREVIVRAVDLLRAKHGVTAAAAFEMIQASTPSGDSVSDAAAEIVRRASG